MSLNSNDRKQIVKDAISDGYRKSTDGTKLIDDKGGRIKFAESGGSVNVNGTTYNTPSGARNSTKR
ncbi:MAG: hypothetical protein IPJ76_01445 [Flavobacteriales bacterium]|nr:MAG: hypothetical protein IPJ76_01445 [Flavobacteriales bacterium]